MKQQKKMPLYGQKNFDRHYTYILRDIVFFTTNFVPLVHTQIKFFVPNYDLTDTLILRGKNKKCPKGLGLSCLSFIV